MQLDIRMVGLETVLKRMQTTKDKSSLSIGRAMVRGGLNVIGKQMKADLQPKARKGKTAVKGRFKKGNLRIVAKVGFGVGPRNKKSIIPALRGKRGGVGIGPNNIHWWVAGTKRRFTGAINGKPTGNRILNRGSMPAMQPGLARIAYAKSVGKVKAEMIKRGALQLNKESDKLKKVK